MRLFRSMDNTGAETGVSTQEAPPVDASTSVETPAQTESQPAAYGFDDYDRFVATPWLSELPEDRRTYLSNGFKSLYESRKQQAEELAQRQADWEERHASATREAATYRQWLETANPDFGDLVREKQALQTKLAEAAAASEELARVKADYASGQATLAELNSAIKAKSDALAKFESERANAITEANEAKEAAKRASERAEVQEAEFSDALLDATMAALATRAPGATDAELEVAATAYLTTLEAEIAKVSSADIASARRGIMQRAMSAAIAALPKPDFIPASVRGANHNGAVRSTSTADAIAAEYATEVAAIKDPMTAIENVAKRLSVSTMDVMTAVSKASKNGAR